MPSHSRTGFPSIDKPWLKYYSDTTISASLPENSIYEYMYNQNKDYPNDIALVYFQRKISYGEFFEKIDNCARALIALGVKEREIVTIALPSIPEALYLVYALNKIGAVANMIHPLAGERELVNYLREVDTRVAFLFDGSYRLLQNAMEETGVETAVIVSAAESLTFGIKQLYKLKNRGLRLQGSMLVNWDSFLKKGKGTQLKSFPKDPNSLALISHTGGTTGDPKGVMCSDYQINAQVWQITETIPHNRQEHMLVVLPPFVNYSLVNGMFEPLAMGHKVILIPDYKPERFGEYIKRYRPNHMNTIPAYLEAALKIKDFSKVDCSCLEYVYYGGEALSPETEEQVNQLFLSCGAKKRIGKGLGATELISAATKTTDRTNAAGSVGIPMVKVNCKIVEPETTVELSYYQEGEICFSGPTVMMGYYNNKDATDAVVKRHEDGERWLHTGDIGYMTEEGVLYVTGRIKRIIMTKGKDGQVTKLFPDRIERVLSKHPAVQLCCVVGVPDPTRINYPKAVVELLPSEKPSEQLEKEIISFCTSQLPEYQIPEQIAFVDSLPRTPRGKVDYRAVEQSV